MKISASSSPPSVLNSRDNSLNLVSLVIGTLDDCERMSPASNLPLAISITVVPVNSYWSKMACWMGQAPL